MISEGSVVGDFYVVNFALERIRRITFVMKAF